MKICRIAILLTRFFRYLILTEETNGQLMKNDVEIFFFFDYFLFQFSVLFFPEANLYNNLFYII